MGIRLAITGMIASGKSTVLEGLGRLGWQTMCADRIADEVAKGIEAQQYLQREGIGNRNELRTRFIADGVFRQGWQSIIHAGVQQERARKLAENPHANWAVELPLLYENKLEGQFDSVVVCSCSQEIALARWAKKDREVADYKKLSQLQQPIAEKIARADYTIENNNDFDDLQQQINVLHNKIIYGKYGRRIS